MLAELESLAARMRIAVRAEPFGSGLLRGRGGLCWVRGQPLVVMDAALGMPDRIAILAEALSRFDLEDRHTPPAVRERIESARRGPDGPAPRDRNPPKRGKPGRSASAPSGPGLARTRPRER
jgi:hypothetical protein